jgi:hypothetical protein
MRRGLLLLAWVLAVVPCVAQERANYMIARSTLPGTCDDGNTIILTAASGGFTAGAMLVCFNNVFTPVLPAAILVSGTALPSTCIVGAIFTITTTSKFYICAITDTWTEVGAGTGGAPTDAQYWTGAADAALSAEKNLGGLGTGLVLNTGGVPSAYAGATCSNAFVRGLNASGVATCNSVVDADVANNITIDLATAATALAADPADCATSTHFAVGVNASGTATCEAIADADVPNNITVDLATLATTATTANAGDSATGFFPAGTLEVARGGTNLAASADDNVMTGNGTTWETKAVPSCSAAGEALTYTTSSNTWGCTTLSVAPTTLTSTTLQSDAVIATYTAITGLAFTPAAATKYWMDCFIKYTSTAATTGINFAWDVPAAVTSIHMSGYTTTTALGANEGFIQRADNVGTPTSASIITTEQVAVLAGLLVNGANATSTTLGFTPETANSVSVLAGSICQVRVVP